jgi:hypothetical protein
MFIQYLHGNQSTAKWKKRGERPRDLFRMYRPVRITQCLPLCRVLAMRAACAHAAHVGTPAAFGDWQITVWNAMVLE